MVLNLKSQIINLKSEIVMVQITDNWGYCNGECIDGLCKNQYCDEEYIEDSSTYFKGYLVVLPENTEN